MDSPVTTMSDRVSCRRAVMAWCAARQMAMRWALRFRIIRRAMASCSPPTEVQTAARQFGGKGYGLHHLRRIVFPAGLRPGGEGGTSKPELRKTRTLVRRKCASPSTAMSVGPSSVSQPPTEIGHISESHGMPGHLPKLRSKFGSRPQRPEAMIWRSMTWSCGQPVTFRG